jgi:hypothetical protein
MAGPSDALGSPWIPLEILPCFSPTSMHCTVGVHSPSLRSVRIEGVWSPGHRVGHRVSHRVGHKVGHRVDHRVGHRVGHRLGHMVGHRV